VALDGRGALRANAQGHARQREHAGKTGRAAREHPAIHERHLEISVLRTAI